jgi:uncharacterized membrane protein (DUF373 family)
MLHSDVACRRMYNSGKPFGAIHPRNIQRDAAACAGMFRDLKLGVPHTQVHRVARRLLEPAQDLLVLGIGLALFGLMVRTLIWLFRAIIVRGNLDYRGVIAQVLFMLVMVEVVRLVIIYLEEHRIAVDFMVELGIVATLREVVLRGVTEIAWQEVIALTVFLLALGALLRFGDLRSGLKLKNGGFQADPTFLPRDTDQITEERG